MPPSLSTDPEDRMGVYQALSEVPERYHFANFCGEYTGDGIWEKYLDYYLSVRGDSACKRTRAERALRNWRESMNKTQRHYALAQPKDVENWSEKLLDGSRSRQYAYESYWANIERFYSWLMWHPDHPHLYQPFWMAAKEYPEARRMWALKMASPRSENDD